MTLDNYRVDKKGVMGVRARCKDCDLVFRHSKNEVMNDLYRSEIKSSKVRGHKPPAYSSEEFKAFLHKNNTFNTLYDNWVKNNYIKDLKPSVDRLDDTKGYDFDNIQIVTWRENYMKETSNHKVKIKLIDMSGKEIVFTSIKDTAKHLSVYTSNIHRYLKNGEYFKGFKITKIENKDELNVR